MPREMAKLWPSAAMVGLVGRSVGWRLWQGARAKAERGRRGFEEEVRGRRGKSNRGEKKNFFCSPLACFFIASSRPRSLCFEAPFCSEVQPLISSNAQCGRIHETNRRKGARDLEETRAMSMESFDEKKRISESAKRFHNFLSLVLPGARRKGLIAPRVTCREKTHGPPLRLRLGKR